MNRGLSVFINDSPLTPSLSRGEREQQGTACETPESVGFVGRQQRFMVPMRVETTSRLPMNRGLSVSINHFPLTPTLSLGEREQQGTACKTPESVGFVGRQQKFMVPVRVETTSRLPMNRGLWVFINDFPLTSSLSRGEREQQGTACETPESVGFVGRQQRFMVPMRVNERRGFPRTFGVAIGIWSAVAKQRRHHFGTPAKADRGPKAACADSESGLAPHCKIRPGLVRGAESAGFWVYALIK